MAIEKFDGEYAFLSNFYPCSVECKGIKYQCAEAAYQAQKYVDPELRLQFATMNGAQAKRAGRNAVLHYSWDNAKFGIMLGIVRAKFRQNPELAEKLIKTGNHELIEGNTWHDTIWGVCNGEGKNHLGKILMKVRGEMLWTE